MVKRLSTPFKEWDAYDLGIIDERGNILKSRKELRTVKERKAFGLFDLMILNLKKLVEKIPGGKTRLGSYAAALYLLKEQDDLMNGRKTLNEGDYTSYLEQVKTLSEEAPVTSVGSGDIAGIGYGPDGEPGVTKKQANRYKKKNIEQLKKLKRFKDYK